MPKTWVLDSETKGTGAEMVPLEKKLARRGREQPLQLVDLGGPPPAPPTAGPPQPLLFRVVDVMSARVLADRAGAREAVRALEALRSVVDARVSVWVPASGRWRLLGLDETKALWAYRGSVDSLPGERESGSR
jgi:hypothetical protein